MNKNEYFVMQDAFLDDQDACISLDFNNKCFEQFQKLSQSLNFSPSPITNYLNLKEDEKQYYILDRDSGKYIDSRKIEYDTQIQLPQTMHWETYWKECKELSQKFLNAVQNDDFNLTFQIVRNSHHFIDINIKDLDDWNASHFACNNNNPQLLQFLMEENINVETLTSQKRTCLHFCALRNAYHCAELLVKMVDIDLQDNQENTALHLASYYGNDQIVELLLQHKARVDLKNNLQLLPIEMAQNSKLLEIFQKYNVSLGGYSRTWIQGTEIVIPNSRADHVRNLLQKVNFQNQKQEAPVQEQKRRLTTWEKLKNFAIEFTRISLFKSTEVDQDKLGPHQFIFYQKLGEGAFGQVHLVEKKGQPDKYYAMKILEKESLEEKNLINSAKTEKDILKVMNHPFIVKLNYAFQTNTRIFLVMDLCTGGDLSNMLEQYGRFSEDVVRIYAAELTLALEALHKNGIIFRDLKPENVVLDEEGHAMLTDFGLSKKGVDDQAENQSFCGTLQYLAPEVLAKKGHNRQVDWYMLGILIYELLTGYTTYHDTEPEIVKDNILRGPVKMPKFFSNEVSDLILKLISRDPKKRLGAIEDGQEVRNHPFFADIDWNACYQRQLKPPKPIIKHVPQKASRKTFNSDDRKNRIDDWTFIQ